MKKYIIFMLSLVVLFSTNFSVKADPNSNALSRMTGVDPTINNKPKATPTPTPIPLPTPDLTLKGQPLDPKDISKNQQRDGFMANGMYFYKTKNYSSAIEEFKKARAMSPDVIVTRWHEVSENRKKIKEVKDIIQRISKKKELKTSKAK